MFPDRSNDHLVVWPVEREVDFGTIIKTVKDHVFIWLEREALATFLIAYKNERRILSVLLAVTNTKMYKIFYFMTIF